jgi:Cu+-exporting ATPase
MKSNQTIEVPIHGMCCAEEAADVRRAIASVPGVQAVEVLLTAEKAIVHIDPAVVSISQIRGAVASTGCSVPTGDAVGSAAKVGGQLSRQVLGLFGVIFGVVLSVVVVGEWLGLFEAITERVPWFVWLILLAIAGYPIFRNVLSAALRRQVTSHTLMTIGAVAAMAVGEWAAAAVVVFFMRVGDYAERFTSQRARRALKDLIALAPQVARVERFGAEVEVPIGEVTVGDIVVVRPGEKIPVDGEVVSGYATIDQATITGESMPVEALPGAKVFAATITQQGALRISAIHIGADTTFGRVIKLVEEAEAHRADVQRIADRFSAYYLPIVTGVALITFLLSRNALATAAVLVVACSCSFAIATPIAMLASVGAAAKRGLLIKGGKYLESLARADVVLLDKTGTLTLGRPQITDILPLNGISQDELLALAASTEWYSEHPLAAAVRAAATERQISLHEPARFEAVAGFGVRAQINGSLVAVGSHRIVSETASFAAGKELEAQGKTLLYVTRQGEPIGILAASDTLRPEVPDAITALRSLGIWRIELLTGDNERTAASLAERLGVDYRANLLPEDKIAVVKDYQARGHVVVMVGDGVNDAPALAQSDVGIAMGAAGTDVAIEAAHIALMRDDWQLVPDVFHIARRTMRVVKLNIGFTAVYNVLGLSLAALGLLPLVFAAAAQSLPDLGILANSARLLRQHKGVLANKN